MTYLDGLRHALAACHEQRNVALADRREAIQEKNTVSQYYTTAEILMVGLCIERIQALIEKARA